MTTWSIIVLISILGVMGLGIYNIKSLIKKWKENPGNWFDLLVGIGIWVVALIVLIIIFIGQLSL